MWHVSGTRVLCRRQDGAGANALGSLPYADRFASSRRQRAGGTMVGYAIHLLYLMFAGKPFARGLHRTCTSSSAGLHAYLVL
jgi:hypothetical protein